MLMATDWHARDPVLPADMVPCGLAISGLFNLLPLLETNINDGLRLDRALATELSPIHLPRPAGRLHAVVGGAEGVEYETQSRMIAEVWGGTWESLPGEDHFTILAGLPQRDSALVQTALKMIAGSQS
jgi:arylformamidase